MTFGTLPFVECSRISQIHSFLMSLIWMLGRYWNGVFYVKYEFLFNNLEWFLGYLTLYHSCQTFIDILCGSIKSYHFLIILECGKGKIGGSFRFLILFCVPAPSLSSHLRFCHRKVLLSDALIIRPRCMLNRKKFSPCSFCLHGFDDIFDQFFILFYRIGGIEDTVMFVIMKPRTSKTILNMVTILRIECF